ncbi:cellulase family glycosylhydrolase [Pseudoduganella sp. FT55W]|uniref:Cellulase family glycosylhydrolase n=1 Tax=Duganella rivi TaxID=2666083 RepID=A0A7X4K9Q6_9BURK|nr:cellulase family glycosylhydrolase [Duganella rivi]MYM65439.1 cellulase family glycosylhydrolase [Duganella rivi]
MIDIAEFLSMAEIARLKQSSSPSRSGIAPGSPETFLLVEGDSIAIKAAAASTGVAQQYSSDGSLVKTVPIAADQKVVMGPLSGINVIVVNCTAGSLDATVGSAVLGSVQAAALSPLEKINALNLTPFSFNYYSILSDQYYNLAGGNSSRAFNLQYIKDCGGKLVRVGLTGFSGADYTSFIHNTATLPDTVTDANLRPTFKAACDTYMDALAAYGLIGMHCILFGQATIPGLFGETKPVAYGSTTSKTAIYAQSLMTWFVSRYRDHPAIGMMSIGNEYTTDNAGLTDPTPAQLGAWFKSVADAARAAKPGIMVTANITAPVIVLNRTKETVEQSVARYRVLFAGLDAYCLHMYGYYAFTGLQNLEVGTLPIAVYNSFGYEGVEPMMQAYADMARADRKPLIIGEWGVSIDNEYDADTASQFYSTRKKWRLAKAVVPYAHTSLMWNVQLTSIAAASGQSVWAIDPQAATSRAADIMAIAKAFNYAQLPQRNVGGAMASRRNAMRPACAMRNLGNRGGGINIRFTSTAAHQSSTGYALMFWFKLTGTLNNAEVMMDFRNAAASAGFAILARLVANNKSFYSDGRYFNGTAGVTSGNTNDRLPDFELGEWHHVAYKFKLYNSNGTRTGVTEIWLDSVYWETVGGAIPAHTTAQVPGDVPDSIPVGTTIYAMCNASNGVPFSAQDIVLLPSIVDDQEIWDHMAGAVNRRSMLHIRAFPDGTIADISANAVALTISGIGVAVER